MTPDHASKEAQLYRDRNRLRQSAASLVRGDVGRLLNMELPLQGAARPEPSMPSFSFALFDAALRCPASKPMLRSFQGSTES